MVTGRGDNKMIQARINQIKQQIETTTSDYDKENCRKDWLNCPVVWQHCISVPLQEVEMKDEKTVMMLYMLHAAIEEGIVAGGGVALIRCIPALISSKGSNEDENIGIQIVKNPLKHLLRIIAENAGA